MRQFIISEERLKMLLKHERELCYVKTYSFSIPPNEALEPTEDDLKVFTEIKEHEYIPDIDKEFANLLKKIINQLKEKHEE